MSISLKLYISKLPPFEGERPGFYFKPLANVTPGGPWYSIAPLGHNTLKSMLKNMFKSAGLDMKIITNHNLRAMSITRMYEASIPEKMIMERSGHLSKEGLRSYERTSAQQVKSLCNILSPKLGTAATVPQVSQQHVTENGSDNKENCAEISQVKQLTEDAGTEDDSNNKENCAEVKQLTEDVGSDKKANNPQLAGVPNFLKPLNFQQVTRCTLNIHLNIKPQ